MDTYLSYLIEVIYAEILKEIKLWKTCLQNLSHNLLGQSNRPRTRNERTQKQPKPRAIRSKNNPIKTDSNRDPSKQPISQFYPQSAILKEPFIHKEYTSYHLYIHHNHTTLVNLMSLKLTKIYREACNIRKPFKQANSPLVKQLHKMLKIL